MATPFFVLKTGNVGITGCRPSRHKHFEFTNKFASRSLIQTQIINKNSRMSPNKRTQLHDRIAFALYECFVLPW